MKCLVLSGWLCCALAQAAPDVMPAAAPELVTPAAVPAATPELVVPAAVAVAPTWEIVAGASLRATLDQWCRRAGYRLVWNVDGGYRAQADYTARGEFASAVRDLFAAVRQDLRLRVELSANKVVLVSRGVQ